MHHILSLIVGTNPLPNFVVSFFKKDSYDSLCLIHSEKNNIIGQESTLEFADNIWNLLKNNGISKEKILIPLKDVSSAEEIRRCLDEYLEKFRSAKSIHLNYTGGTKVMAVHVYKFFNDRFGEKTSFSYLDPRGLRLCYDDGNIERIQNIQLKIADFLDLHGYEIENQTNARNIPWQALLSFYESIKYDESAISDYEEFVGKYITPLKKAIEEANKGNLKDYEARRNEILNDNYVISNNLQSVLEQLFPKAPSRSQLRNNIKNAAVFLEGKWLEYLVLLALRDIANEKVEGEHFGWGFEAIKRDGGKNFELDNYFIDGYQLYGISVTTDNKESLCKLKAFEVYHRVTQIGGEEGRAILVCGLDENKIESFKRDILQSTGASKERLYVIGKKNWSNLTNALSEVINE